MLLIDIDKSELEREFAKHEKKLRIHPAVIIIAVIADIIILGISESLVFTFFVTLVFMLVYGIIKIRKTNPKVFTFRVRTALSLLSKYPTAETTRQQLYIMTSESRKFTDKVMTGMFLSELYLYRDDIAAAIDTMKMTDKTQLAMYPEAAAYFYHELIAFYYAAHDYQSVMNVYADAKPYFESQMHKDFTSLINVLDAMIYVYSAADKNDKALDLMLTKNSYYEKMKRRKSNSASSNINIGMTNIEAAEIYHKAGDINSARQMLNAAEPYSSVSPHIARRTEQLKQEIGQ